MSYIRSMLMKDERILYQPSIAKIAYINAIIVLAVTFHPLGILRLARTELALTSTRILGSTGILGRASIAVNHADVESVTVRRGLLGTLLDYGTVIVTAKNGTRVAFKGIIWPLVFQQEADEAIEIAVLGRKLSDYAPDF